MLNDVLQSRQAEHPKRVADLFQKIQLRHQIIGLLHAGSHENIENVFDTQQVVLDGRTNRLHQLDTRSRQAIPCALYLVLGRQKFPKTETTPDRGDPTPTRCRSGHVEEKAIEQRNRRAGFKTALSFFNDAAYLPIHLAKQSLDGGRAFQPALAQPFYDPAGDPPKLVTTIFGRRIFKLTGHIRHHGEAAFGPLAPNPTQQCGLKTRSQLTRKACHIDTGWRCVRLAGQLDALLGGQVQEQQRVLREQWLPAHRAQIV